MNIDELKQLIKKMPIGPGVYVFKSSALYPSGSGKAIYIGKAASIKRRLVSYTRNEDHRINTMVAAAATIQAIETPTEIEALILESQLIKQKRPQFNIMLRDDKNYTYVEFSSDEWPRIRLAHQPMVPSAIGPFTDATALKTTLRLLRNIFPYCTCKQLHYNYCLNYHIGKCMGVCCLKQPELRMTNQELSNKKKQYLENIKAIKDILSGKKAKLISQLRKEMDRLARTDNLEGAITLRTKLDRLEQVFVNAKIIKSSQILKDNQPFLAKVLKTRKSIIRIEGYDISNIGGKHATGSMVTFVQGEPDKNFYRKFNIKTVYGSNDTAMLAEIIERRLNHDEWPFPDLIIVDGGKGQVNIVRTVLKERDITIPVIGLVKNEKHIGRAILVPGKKEPIDLGRPSPKLRVIDLAKISPKDRNLLLAIDAEAHRFAISHYRSRHRRQTLTK